MNNKYFCLYSLCRSRISSEEITLIFSTLFLFALFLIAWWSSAGQPWSPLYWNGDGEFFAWHAKAMLKWTRPFDILSLNPFQGMVSTYLPYSPWWTPGALALSFPFKTSTNYLISYSIYWFETVISIFLFARTVGLTKTESILSSQLFVFCFFPPFNPGVFQVLWLAPFFIHLMAICNVIVVLFIKLGEVGWVKNCILFFLTLLLFFILFMSSSFHLPIFAFTYAIICSGLTLNHLNRNSIVWKLAIISFLVIFLLMLKVPEYYSVMADYSVRINEIASNAENKFISFSLPHHELKYNFCAPELAGVNLLSFFCAKSRNIMSYIYIFSLIGIFISLYWRSGKYKRTAISFFLIAILEDLISFCFQNSIIQGQITSINPGYIGLSSQIFYIIPFIIFISYVWENFFKMGYWVYINTFNKKRIQNFKTKKDFSLPYFASMFIPIFTIYFLYVYLHENAHKTLYEEKATASIEYLRNNISINPGSTFRGYSLTYFVGSDSPLGKIFSISAIDKNAYSKSDPYDHYLHSRLYLKDRAHYGNMHIFSDLWKYDIPTIEEYAQMISKPMFSFFQNLLNKNQEIEKNKVVHCLYVYDLDLRVLRALGVRFIITDRILSHKGLSKVLEQQPENPEQYIKMNVVEESKKILANFSVPSEFQKLSDNKESIYNKENTLLIENKVFINEFRKKLDHTFGSEVNDDKNRVLGGLSVFLSIVTKGKKSMSFSELRELQTHFYKHLAYYVIPPTFYLYEIENPNLATFSPIHPIHLHFQDEIFDLMKNPDFSFEQSVVVQEEHIPTPLVSAKNTVMRFQRNGVNIHSESDGWSIALLPLQYSNCLQVSSSKENLSSNSIENVRLIRANLIQSALLFKGTIDVRVKFNFDTNCRRQDVIFWENSQQADK